MKNELAFPVFNSDGEANPNELGLTKLEYFTAKAMQGDFAAQNDNNGQFMIGMDMSQAARLWVIAAKAALAELEKEQ